MISQLRDKTFNLLNKMLGPDTSKIIEESMYIFSKEYADTNETPFLLEEIYKNKSEDLLATIGSNLQFIIKSIKNKLINPHMIAFMKSSELDKNQYSVKQDIKPVGSNAFECKKCKNRNTSIEERQVKRADEPATQFITCLECGYVFTKE